MLAAKAREELGMCARWNRPARKIRIAGAALAIGVAAGLASADEVVLAPSRDATLFENPTGATSSGSGPAIFSGRTGQLANSIRRLVIAFDVAANLPAGAQITGVELTLSLEQTSSGPQECTLHRALATWGEGASVGGGGGGAPSQFGDATWIHRFFPDVFWNAPGGDFDPSPSASITVDEPDISYTWGSTPQLVADVQAWLDTPASNHGWLLRGNESVPQSAKRFASRESASAELRPTLRVAFERPCIEPQPVGSGYWNRQCLGVPESAGGLAPGRAGRGPSAPTEPDFVESLMPCADARLAALGLQAATCEGIEARPANEPCERALRSLTTMILNVCSGRLTHLCPVSAQAGCGASTVGELIEATAELILEGACQQAHQCAGAGSGE